MISYYLAALRSLFFLGISGGGGGGNSGPQTTTTNTSNLPAYLQPQVEANVRNAEAAFGEGYEGFGNRVAGFNANQGTAQAATMGMTAPAGQFGQSNQVASNVASGSWNDPGTAASFMNPYQQNVTDIAMQNAARQSHIQGTYDDSTFARAGAFGGSRQGVVDAERGRNLLSQQSNIQTQGLSDAYRQGQVQYNAQNAQQLAAANQLTNQGTAQQASNLALYGAQNAVGAQQQALSQDQLTANYQDFVEQRDWNKQQVAGLSSILHGTPYAAQTTSSSQGPAPNVGAQIAGLGLAAYGAYGANRGK